MVHISSHIRMESRFDAIENNVADVDTMKSMEEVKIAFPEIADKCVIKYKNFSETIADGVDVEGFRREEL